MDPPVDGEKRMLLGQHIKLALRMYIMRGVRRCAINLNPLPKKKKNTNKTKNQKFYRLVQQNKYMLFY